MYLAYIDESGNTGRRLDDPDQPIHWLVGVLVSESQALGLAMDLDRVVSDHIPDDPKRELHGAELFSGDRRWSGVAPGVRLAVYEESLKVLARRACVIAHTSINKPMLQQWGVDAAPHLIALHFLTEKIDAFVAAQDDVLHQRALLVADETNEHEAFAIDLISDLQRRGIGVFRGRELRNIVDTVHFVRSETNRGVQVADLVAYAMARVSRVARTRPTADMSRGDLALRRMLDEHVWSHVKTWRQLWPGN